MEHGLDAKFVMYEKDKVIEKEHGDNAYKKIADIDNYPPLWNEEISDSTKDFFISMVPIYRHLLGIIVSDLHKSAKSGRTGQPVPYEKSQKISVLDFYGGKNLKFILEIHNQTLVEESFRDLFVHSFFPTRNLTCLHNEFRVALILIYNILKVCPEANPAVVSSKDTLYSPLETIKIIYRLVTMYWLDIANISVFGSLEWNDYKYHSFYLQTFFCERKLSSGVIPKLRSFIKSTDKNFIFMKKKVEFEAEHPKITETALTRCCDTSEIIPGLNGRFSNPAWRLAFSNSLNNFHRHCFLEPREVSENAVPVQDVFFIKKSLIENYFLVFPEHYRIFRRNYYKISL